MPDTLADATRQTADLVKTIFIEASPQVVWDYLTRAEHLAKWFQETAEDLAPGASYTMVRDGERVLWGEVLDWQPPERLVTTFTVGPMEGRSSTVEWVLEPVVHGTRLTLTHRGVVPADAQQLPLLAHLDIGWDKHLARLREAAAA
ncbi:SRPBCC domain-containing protein [Rhodobacteraceae bacterium 2CG4]|uniref:SRPBCC domain-containing protein n=1 Tax=Halovulum marinum TaxID=2662447 RepID=A0A6L5YV01_9RHOB|nr:SRPBCC domain-containing protein [Halovulum marinum]MSU88087.1 SRPBCC domain-containing protein [Halovulum marinum]